MGALIMQTLFFLLYQNRRPGWGMIIFRLELAGSA